MALGTGLGQGIGLLSMPVLTRLYEPSSFAELALLTQALGIATIAFTWRYEYAVPLPKRHESALSLVRLVMLLCVAGTLLWTVVSALAAPVLKQWTQNASVTLWYLLPITGALASGSVALQLMTQRQGLYRHAGIAEVASKGTFFVAAMVGAFVLPQPHGLLAAVALGMLGKTIYLAPLTNWRADAGAERTAGRWFRRARLGLRQHRHLAMSMSGSHLLLTLTGLLPTVFIGRTYGSDALGQWALVQSTAYVPSALLGSAVGQVYYQRAAAAHASGHGFADLWRMTLVKLLWIGLPCFACLALVAPWLYPFAFGPRWTVAGEIAPIIALSALLAFVSTPLDRSCVVVGALRYIRLWHIARLTTTVLVLAIAVRMDWNLTQFVIAITVQMSALYLVDLVAERRFALRNPKQRLNDGQDNNGL